MSMTIVDEGEVSFKELEKSIYAFICELGREITKVILEEYDKDLAKKRDKKEYRNKGLRGTSIKTVYGEVEYSRRVYRTQMKNGETAHIFLLDQMMHMDKIGLISTNLAERISMTVTEAPYRTASDIIGTTSGQTISAMGIWNLIQQLGERISDEEEYSAKQMDADESTGKKVIPILFEEMDGVWLSMQDSKQSSHGKQMR